MDDKIIAFISDINCEFMENETDTQIEYYDFEDTSYIDDIENILDNHCIQYVSDNFSITIYK